MTDILPKPIRRLREIAEAIRVWENEWFAKSNSTSRPLYFADLQEIAAMFEGTHKRYRATVQAKGGWQLAVVNTQRDFEIAEFMAEQRAQPDFEYEKAIKKAAEKFKKSDKLIERADRKYRAAAESDADKDMILFMEMMVAGRLAKKTQP